MSWRIPVNARKMYVAVSTESMASLVPLAKAISLEEGVHPAEVECVSRVVGWEIHGQRDLARLAYAKGANIIADALTAYVGSG